VIGNFFLFWAVFACGFFLGRWRRTNDSEAKGIQFSERAMKNLKKP